MPDEIDEVDDIEVYEREEEIVDEDDPEVQVGDIEDDDVGEDINEYDDKNPVKVTFTTSEDVKKGRVGKVKLVEYKSKKVLKKAKPKKIAKKVSGKLKVRKKKAKKKLLKKVMKVVGKQIKNMSSKQVIKAKKKVKRVVAKVNKGLAKRGPKGPQWKKWRIPYQENSTSGQVFLKGIEKHGIKVKELKKICKSTGANPVVMLKAIRSGKCRGWMWDVDDSNDRLKITNYRIGNRKWKSK